jgi:hypothetical protein
MPYENGGALRVRGDSQRLSIRRGHRVHLSRMNLAGQMPSCGSTDTQPKKFGTLRG